ncbi:hypothetical protein NG895_07580 [Aeoliella sp. ICT_H6.2]|uniref:Cytochrome c domain-containing protein n=1 Tax=Aeoliella straminimaris TaxID=2954799 RepID=A0A9X2F8F5_9BACT|nr:hypothetical protein [Aeoliella straminimaris]MCO6043764.1 hypothetical protein [Aeoliella straminimaris]
MRRLCLTLLLMCLATLTAHRASAFVEFHKEWVNTYIDDTDESQEMKDYQKLVAKGKYRCLVCHQGKKKDNRNAYGKQFEGKISKDDKKDTAKIAKVLKEVGEMKSDPDDEDSATYDELIADKKFPGGELEDLEKEPETEEEE